MSIQQQQIELPAEVGSHSEIFVNVPINVFNKKNSLHTEMDFSFQTKLSGSVSHIKKDWDINFSEPFVMQYHQVPFRHDSIIVQIMLKSISSITLRIKSFKISPKDKSTSQFTGTIKKLTNMRSNAGLPLLRNSSSLSLRSSGKGSGNFQEDIVVLPENEVGIAYIFRNPPQVTEEWNFTLGYEFAPWSECEVVSRTFSSTFHMGLNNPEFIVNLSFPKNVIVGNIFDVKVSVSVNAAVGVKVSRENLEKMKMKVTACDPRQLIIQGFSQRIVDLSPLLAQSSDGGVGGENQQKPPKMEFVFRVITLHTGEIFVPRVEIMDSTNTNKARVLSEHPIILSLSDTHYILSSEREDDKEQSIENDSKKVSTKKSEVISIFDTMPQRISRVMNVVWVHSSASTIVSSTRCSQRMEGIKARLSAEQKIKMTIIYTTYDRWVATRDDKMLGPDKLKNIRLIVDERDRIASKVLLYVRQEPSLAEVPIIIFCEDKNKNWSEFSHLNNVFAANTLQDIEDTLTYNPSNFGFTSRGCTSIDSAPLLTSSVLNSSALSGFLTKSSGIVTTPQSRFHKLTRSQKK